MNFEQARFNMVEQQIRPWEVIDQDILDLLYVVPREDFVPPASRNLAFVDMEIPLGEGERMWAPKIEARALQALAVRKTERVLEVGTGSGYQAAILSQIAKHVYTIDRFRTLIDLAELRFNTLRIKNITALVGDGTLGWPEAAPFDRIIVTAAGPDIPESLRQQLDVGGILVMPVCRGDHEMLVRAERAPAGIVTHDVCRCAFVRLIGKEGWSEGA